MALTLNPEQAEAVARCTATNYPYKAAISAGAGSGKTTVLTRIASTLLDRGESVAVITFTNPAARSIRERLDDPDEKAFTGTIHSFCLRHVRDWRGELELPKLKPLDDAGFKRMLEAMAGRPGKDWASKLRIDHPIPEHLADEVADNSGAVLAALGDLWNETSVHHRQSNDAMYKLAEKIAPAVYRTVLDNRHITFDLMISEYVDMMGRHLLPYDNILLDEAQDTNLPQLAAIEHSWAKRFIAVGDARQSIYAFRGSAPGVFDRLRTEARVLVELTTNHRSVPEVVRCTNRLSEDMRESNLVAARPATCDIAVESWSSHSGYDEAEKVLSQITRMYHYRNIPLNDIAILVRVHADANDLRARFESARPPMPYRAKGKGGIKPIWEYKGTAQVYSLIAVLLGEDTEAMAARGLAYLQGIGPVTASKLAQEAPLLLRQREMFGTRVHRAIAALDALELTGDEPASEILIKVVNLNRPDDETWPDRLIATGLDGTIREWYDEVALYAGDEGTDSDDRVTISTCHAAKGLEWRQVIVLACSDKRFPSFMTEPGNAAQHDEERRLFYVACTRAKNTLIVSQVEGHFSRGRHEHAELSPFATRLLEDRP